MGMQAKDFEVANAGASEPASQLSDLSIRCLLRTLAATLPPNVADSPEIAAEKWEAARELFFFLQPRNPVEAVLAARAVAAHFATLDLYARAAVPGTSDDKVLRLRGKAITESRSFDAALRDLDNRHEAAAQIAAAREATPPSAHRVPIPPMRPERPIPPEKPGANDRPRTVDPAPATGWRARLAGRSAAPPGP
jgi:hypothetical protein